MQVKTDQTEILHQMLRERGVAEGDLNAAAQAVLEHNTLEGAHQIVDASALEFPASFEVSPAANKFSGRVAGQHAQIAQGEPSKPMGALAQFAFDPPSQQGPRVDPRGQGDEPHYILAPPPGGDGPYYIIAPDGTTHPGGGGQPRYILPPPPDDDGPYYIIAPDGTTHPGQVKKDRGGED